MSNEKFLNFIYMAREMIYRQFCKAVFRKRKFVCSAEFNTLIKEEISVNTTFVRRRMIDMQLIKIEHHVVKPF